MSIKLRIASIWTPQFILTMELDRVSEATVDCLDELLEKYDSELKVTLREMPIIKGNIEERRKIMASAHNVRVKALIDILGYDKAIEVGRNALFKVGLKLGREARERLGVGDSLHDLIMAARVLYKVLGIEFEVNRSGEELNIIVLKCSLAKYYTVETCGILSAADEGVVQGLNENIHMTFTQKMTEGYGECIACLRCE